MGKISLTFITFTSGREQNLQKQINSKMIKRKKTHTKCKEITSSPLPQ
jgi:hypothetical protein